jgi:hypothetical protein
MIPMLVQLILAILLLDVSILTQYNVMMEMIALKIIATKL